MLFLCCVPQYSICIPLSLNGFTLGFPLNLMARLKKLDLSENMMDEKTIFSSRKLGPFKILVTEKDSN